MSRSQSGALIVLATRNPGKLRELRPMFDAAHLAVVDLTELQLAESPDEDGLEHYATFEENALAKARHFARQTGLPVVADDSGLEVAALNGQPGVRSKRWSGREDVTGAALDAANNALLMASLRDVADRAARYVCVAAYVGRGREVIRRGEVPGHIIDRPRGADGFGYDPYFVAEEAGRTFGELTVAEKEQLSHRGRAVAALIRAIAGLG